MYEKKLKIEFVTDLYGGAVAGGAANAVLNWMQERQVKGLMAWGEQIKKKGETAQDAIKKILSVHHRDEKGFPVIGNWMVKRMLIVTGHTIFNALKDRNHPKKDAIANSILTPEPIPYIKLSRNGGPVKKPDGIETYTVSLKSRSFFKAYEYIKAGASAEFMVYFDDNIIEKEHAEKIIESAGRFGLGSFRERFGKFKYI